MSKHNILKATLAALLIHAPHLCSYDYWRNLKNAPSTIWQWMSNNTKKTAIGSTIALGSIALYLYNKYRNTLEELEKPVIIGDARVSRFVNNWRDAGDIRREFEDPENWPFFVLGVPDNPNVDVNVAERSEVYDIRNLLLPPKQLFDPIGVRRLDFNKYEVTLNKMTYVMRQNTGYRDFIGFITFYTRHCPSAQKFPPPTVEGYIELMLIREKFRGKGYAEQLMKFVLGKMKQMGISRAVLTTGVDNKRAQAFYEKMGFIPTKKQPYDGFIIYKKYINN